MTARVLFAITAAVLWIGQILSAILSATDYYPVNTTAPGLYGDNPLGMAGFLGREIDHFSYFTIWSNLLAAIIFTMLAINPNRPGSLFRVLRLDAIVMMIVTGIVYNVLLNTGGHEGWDFWSNGIQHIFGPLLVFIVFVICGPRGWISSRTIFASLILPILWLVYALIRGSVTGAYPYDFLDVNANGMASVLAFVAQIVIFAIILGYLLLLIDKLMRKFFPNSKIAV
jgi:apolipoprotein N-acyltransferase